ncbi:MAG: exodeoxyribonuclease VII large subunit [Verrucomicrobiota bacterium]
MPKSTGSQWDFGELFPEEATRHVLSVSELTGQVRRLLEKQVGRVWVLGEISNLRAQSSGHFYFTLKDAGAQLNCILFRGDCTAQREFLADGRKVLLQGEMTVYEVRGQYQLRVVAMELQGVGALQVAFEKLKQKLSAEGWFAPERKRPLPRFPEVIGLVTSPTGAAIRDVLHVVQRRNPGLRIIFASCRVQGPGAAEEISTALRNLNQWRGNTSCGLDLILVTRGGGSLEDLWAFNEEILARAIYESPVPIVSAVGHEIDFTLSDFVADLRAATPSAAAEMITEGVFSSCRFVSEIGDWIRDRTRSGIAAKTLAMTNLARRLARAHPRRRIDTRLQHLDDLQTGLFRCVKNSFRKQQTASGILFRRLWRLRPRQFLHQRQEVIELARGRLIDQGRHALRQARNRVENLEVRLRLLSPQEVLARGYSITTDSETGAVVRRASEVRLGQKLKIRLAGGEIGSVVEKTN